MNVVHTIPAKLYKYLPVRENIFPLILRYTPPGELNDPYEVFPNVEVEFTLEELRKLAAENNVQTTDEHLQKLVNELPGEFRQKAREDFVKLHKDNGMGILSLTTDPTNLVMWGLYASEHRGIVVELDMTNKFFWPHKDTTWIRAVKYSTVRPKATNHQQNEVIKDWLFTKSSAWEFEKEYRSVTTKVFEMNAVLGKVGTFYVPHDAVSRVYVGLRTEGNFLKSVADYCTHHNIPWGRMEYHPSEYRLVLPMYNFPITGHTQG